MRPLRLLIDGFGSYRKRTEVDFSDVDYFALVGPTGSGKSTILDAIAFALYGTVPRWEDRKSIAYALAPSANSCQLALVFETAGSRYVVSRLLLRSTRGAVQTKEARLERLDDSVPIAADITRLLEASVDQIAEGTEVTSAVERLLGLTYEHFTQCVVLPQGKFAEFLRARPADRQDMLVELLAYGVYGQIGERARELGKRHATEVRTLEGQLANYADADSAVLAAAKERHAELLGLQQEIDRQCEQLAAHQALDTEASARARSGRDSLVALAVATPESVSTLSAQIDQADQAVTKAHEAREMADRAWAAAREAVDALGDRVQLSTWLRCHDELASILVAQTANDHAYARLKAAADRADADKASALEGVAVDEASLSDAMHHHTAVDLARTLRIGEPCPVCLQSVVALPTHVEEHDIAAARRALGESKERLARAETTVDAAGKALAEHRGVVQAANRRREDLEQQLVAAPSREATADALRRIADAADVERRLSQGAETARLLVDEARQRRASLDEQESAARTLLMQKRDLLVAYGAPGLLGRSLAADWDALGKWALAERHLRTEAQRELDASEALARRAAQAAEEALVQTLHDHKVSARSAENARVDVAIALTDAANEVRDVTRQMKAAARLEKQIAAVTEKRQVADELGRLLAAGRFERWLCGEALDALVEVASDTLLALSSGQYQLDRNEKNEFIVIDFHDAGAVRPVSTLSGGETFQASLALALALAHQVVALSGGQRELDSIFLDEGFGTLDEATLDTVASTLESLTGDGDRMVGLITHVPALADRVPVRFRITRDGAGSHIVKELV